MTARRPPTFGVEEEFLLLDPASGHPVPAAPRLLRLLHGRPGPRAELMRYQLETATRVCDNADQLHAELRRLRQLGSEAAQRCGCQLVASGTSPYPTPGLAALTDDPRYRELARRYPSLTAGSGICACHVHVGVPSREHGVQVLARFRPWLPTLLALSANSPLENGHDTGWASRRYPSLARWPTAGPPSIWADAAAYDRAVGKLIGGGAALDQRSIYLLARLSPRYPTVEVRVADVCPDVDTALLLAVLVRALVTTAVADTQAGKPMPHPPRATIVAGLDAAARHGPAGPAIDPRNGAFIQPWTLVRRLVDHAGPALAASGDAATVAHLLRALKIRGTGADRQREAWTRAESPAQLVAELAAATWQAPYDTAPAGAARALSRQPNHRGSAFLTRRRHTAA
ncbi:carboxylate-amine ligase [Krasilnikovia cinnamomea]|uniref:Putative glutamate--cysteine ligase 2 n=1 Tax=Krasilnikovia cinnamomea TaxID=349313 RepID=A0A4Q7ZQ41_9ACTN|nr:glutamate--cysteine ligase [Krasilnikovia cinnamomea]RZU53222.1 carboxylate-amine ligase [Krasilnikovia cinnamomea]